ncbi:prevent-host-death protein [Halarcobacter sp.]|uniref:prevent-host-death protein n=1 Tax=Halarcobacter sp. TaxID=2321133 RepID=UPI0029F5A1A7|nr:prevent-host-death protein [Halarcobacter sp.]
MIINANDVKTKGVSMFSKLFETVDELIINVRGKNKYVVLDIERYKELREVELDLAYIKSMQDIEKGNFKSQSAKEHIEELKNEL